MAFVPVDGGWLNVAIKIMESAIGVGLRCTGWLLQRPMKPEEQRHAHPRRYPRHGYREVGGNIAPTAEPKGKENQNVKSLD